MKKLIIIPLLLSALVISGQTVKEKKTYSVYISDNEQGLTARASVLRDKQDFRPDEELSYSWYALGKVQHTKGGYDGKLLSGPYTSFFLNGNLREKGSYRKGLKNGRWHSWRADGNTQEIVHWKRGLKHGRYVLYNEEGKLVLEANYRANELHGKIKVYEAGKLVGVKNYKKGKEILPDVKEKKENGKWKGLFKKKEKTKRPEAKPNKNERTKKNAVTQL